MSSNVSLRDLAYYRTGGEAKLVVQPETTEQLQDAMRQIHDEALPYFFLGAGTNSLVMDERWPGAVVAFGRMNRLEVGQDATITVGAGVENSRVAQFALENRLAGVAWMNGLPGQIGGTVRMNARCYGGEISEVIIQVTTVTKNGELRTYRDPNVFRGYKDTLFMENGEAIAEVVMQLSEGEPKTIEETMAFCRQDREKKGQYVHPTCGCVFKNNYEVGVPSGMLIEHAGLKGFKHKGAEINPHHANFVYNVQADSRGILETTLLMREKVYDVFGVWLEYEMEILGKLPEDLSDKVREKRPMAMKESKLKPLREQFAGKKTTT